MFWGIGSGVEEKRPTLRGSKVDHVAILLEHVDFLDRLDGLHVHLLQRRLQLLVVGGGGLVDALGLAAGSTLASVVDLSVSNLIWSCMVALLESVQAR
jgi:hypothetical protein